MLTDIWAQLGGDPDALAGVEVDGAADALGGPLRGGELATAAVTAALVAAGELVEARSGHRPRVSVDARHVADAVRSERFLRIDDAPPGRLFDPLSAFFRTADGWVRLHANYPHHQAALLRVLSLPAGEVPDPDEAARRIAERPGAELEAMLADAGGVGAVVRSAAAWRVHPAGATADEQPLIELRPSVAGSGGSAGSTRSIPVWTPESLPANGFRVLDLTRVIAGPVATRTLAALGADVLRVDTPGLPEIPIGHVDTGPGKRTTFLDLSSRADQATFGALLDSADVLVHGYRPGALEGLGIGLDDETLARTHPTLVSVRLSAWGERGPWAGRRGFDSVVQAASGIAVACGSADQPGALPAQVLDHATGHLIAAAALRGLTTRLSSGRSGAARLSLAATAAYLLRASSDAESGPPLVASPAPAGESAYAVALESAYGSVRQVGPPGRLDGRPLTWTSGAHRLGGDAAEWSDGRRD